MTKIKIRPAKRWVTFDVPWLLDEEHRDLLNRLRALFPSGARGTPVVVGLDVQDRVLHALHALVDDDDAGPLHALVDDRTAELYPRVESLAIVRSLYPGAWLAEDPRTGRLFAVTDEEVAKTPAVVGDIADDLVRIACPGCSPPGRKTVHTHGSPDSYGDPGSRVSHCKPDRPTLYRNYYILAKSAGSSKKETDNV